MLPGHTPNPGREVTFLSEVYWGQQHLRPERSPTLGRPRGCNEGAYSSGWTGAKPRSSDRTLLLEAEQLGAERGKAGTGNLWHPLVTRVGNNVQQFSDAFTPDRRDNA